MAKKGDERQPLEQEEAVMVYIAPGVMQSLAGVAARKQESLQELMSAAEDGDLEAEYRLALDYCNGEEGAPKDEKKAFFWFRRAAEGGNIAAQYDLALCYIQGIGTPADPVRAAELLAAAAEAGYLPAICELGLCYELGTGVARDPQRAAELYRALTEAAGGEEGSWEHG